jgi:hypothetical protein
MRSGFPVEKDGNTLSTPVLLFSNSGEYMDITYMSKY